MKKLNILGLKPIKMYVPTKVEESFEFTSEEDKKIKHKKAQERLEILGLAHRERKFHIKVEEDVILIKSKYVGITEKL